MPYPDRQPMIVPSLLDRCREDKLEGTHELPLRRYQTRQEALASIARDLEALFNTYQTPWRNIPPDEELRTSILMYGLPDLACIGQADTRMCQAIEDAIRCFEPRLDEVRVTPEARSPDGLTLRVRIKAVLRLRTEPLPKGEMLGEPVDFEATLALNPRQIVIRGQC